MNVIVNFIANVCSILTITACFILKLPQIKKIYERKLADGINLFALYLELSSYTVMFTYNFTNGYGIITYLEYPIILIQELILIYLVLLYSNKLHQKETYIFIGSYHILTFLFMSQILPKEIIGYLVPLCTPVGAFSKIVQLREIIKTKNSECVSLITWFISAFTNATRIYTVYVDSADLMLLSNFMISMGLSSMVLGVAYHYKIKPIKFE